LLYVFTRNLKIEEEKMRQIVLDTETTGIDPKEGHRIIEIGCVEMINRKLTGNTYHQYINPMREVEEEAIAVHGITNEFLKDKPSFKEIAPAFIEFIKGAELVIHNAPFDIGHMDNEFQINRCSISQTSEVCTVLDTLALARQQRPGQKNNLDALCKVYGVDNAHRTYHGALLDSEILAEVYLWMTGGQTAMSWAHESEGSDPQKKNAPRKVNVSGSLKVVKASADELSNHEAYLDKIEKKSSTVVWRDVSAD
jgi:DNA polymerase-3 subunit epsilon